MSLFVVTWSNSETSVYQRTSNRKALSRQTPSVFAILRLKYSTVSLMMTGVTRGLLGAFCMNFARCKKRSLEKTPQRSLKKSLMAITSRFLRTFLTVTGLGVLLICCFKKIQSKDRKHPEFLHYHSRSLKCQIISSKTLKMAKSLKASLKTANYMASESTNIQTALSSTKARSKITKNMAKALNTMQTATRSTKAGGRMAN
jgi:hypothetical protein